MFALQEVEHQKEKIAEMVTVMQMVAHMDDISAHSNEQKMARLEHENRTLRELLFVSKQFNSVIRLVSSNPHALTAIGGVRQPSAAKSDEDSVSPLSDDENNQESKTSLTNGIVFDYASSTVKKRPSMGISGSSNPTPLPNPSPGSTSLL